MFINVHVAACSANQQCQLSIWQHVCMLSVISGNENNKTNIYKPQLTTVNDVKHSKHHFHTILVQSTVNCLFGFCVLHSVIKKCALHMDTLNSNSMPIRWIHFDVLLCILCG